MDNATRLKMLRELRPKNGIEAFREHRDFVEWQAKVAPFLNFNDFYYSNWINLSGPASVPELSGYTYDPLFSQMDNILVQAITELEHGLTKTQEPNHTQTIMTPEDATAFKKELSDEFVLIPQKKLYYLIGGFLSVVVIATGISLAGVFVYLRSEPAEIARRRIIQIGDESQKALDAIKVNLQNSGNAEVRLKNLEQTSVTNGSVVSFSPALRPGQIMKSHSPTVVEVAGERWTIKK